MVFFTNLYSGIICLVLLGKTIYNVTGMSILFSLPQSMGKDVSNIITNMPNYCESMVIIEPQGAMIKITENQK